MSYLDELAKAVEDKNQPAPQSFDDFAAQVKQSPTVEYHRVDRLVPTSHRSSFIEQHRARCGRGSVILQIFLVAWTALYLIWLASLWVNATTWNYVNNPPLQTIVVSGQAAIHEMTDNLMGIMSALVCSICGWAIIGLPLLISAIATLESPNRP